MDYIITNGLNFSRKSVFHQLEEIFMDCFEKENFISELNKDSKLVVNINRIEGSEALVLSYSLTAATKYIYLIIKGDDIVYMAKKLFDRLLKFLI